MKPDLPQPHTQAHPPARSPRKTRPPLAAIDKDSALHDLSTAGGHYMRSAGSNKSIRRGPSWLLSLLFALAAGAALTFSEPFEYRCTAGFMLTGVPTSYQQSFYRKELLDYAWHRLVDETATPSSERSWFVDAPEDKKLRLCITSTRREVGLERITNLADGYLNHMESLRKQTLSTPTEGEKILSEYLTTLQGRLIKAQGQANTLMAKLPADNPSEDLDSLRNKWDHIHEDFVHTKERLTFAIRELDQLRSEPEPSIGVVSAQHRKEMLQMDRSLQQDLKELKVNLSELKLYVLDVWQQSSGPLQKLSSAVQSLHAMITDSQSRLLSEDIRGQMQQLKRQVQSYQALLAPFVQIWTKEFVTLRRSEINPYNDDIIRTYHRIRSKMNDFLYTTAKHLSDMRMMVTHIGESQSDQARYYVLQSELVRSFQSVQSAHHRFEFAAGRMETPSNFRLDTALKSGRGLFRRTQHQIASIDRHLRTQALARAREQRQEQMKAASRLVNEVRRSADQTIEQLVTIQSDLNLTADEAEAFQRALFEAELATSRLQSLQSHLSEVNHRLGDMEDQHTASAEASHIELQTCSVEDQPINLIERVRIGGLGAILTLFTVLLGQWWIGRRR